MTWLKSNTTILGIFCLALLGAECYTIFSLQTSLGDRLNAVENDYASADEKITMLTSDLDVVTKKMGVTAQELEDAQAAAAQLKQENAQLAKRLRNQLAAKADSKTVLKFQDEARNRMTAVQQEASSKIEGVSGEVKGVRTDLEATRSDLKATRLDLSATRDEVANSKRELGGLIARNSTELAELRRKGERDYVEFDIPASKDFKRIGEVLVQLKKTDPKRQRYDVVINADDSPIQKKDRTANEPVTFLVGRDRVRYELVVNFVDKDRIRGYMSAPKDKLLSAEKPALRVQ